MDDRLAADGAAHNCRGARWRLLRQRCREPIAGRSGMKRQTLTPRLPSALAAATPLTPARANNIHQPACASLWYNLDLHSRLSRCLGGLRCRLPAKRGWPAIGRDSGRLCATPLHEIRMRGLVLDAPVPNLGQRLSNSIYW